MIEPVPLETLLSDLRGPLSRRVNCLNAVETIELVAFH